MTEKQIIQGSVSRIFWPEDGKWIGACVGVDIMASGATIEQAARRLQSTVEVELADLRGEIDWTPVSLADLIGADA